MSIVSSNSCQSNSIQKANKKNISTEEKTKHSFSLSDAKKYGLTTAVILSNFRFWVDINKRNNSKKHRQVDSNGDERYWVYYTVKELREKHFPYLSCRQIEKAISDCPILIRGCFNKMKRDRTNWYTLDENWTLSGVPSVSVVENNDDELTQPFHQNVKCISPKCEMLPDTNLPDPDLLNTTTNKAEALEIESSSSILVNGLNTDIPRVTKRTNKNAKANNSDEWSLVTIPDGLAKHGVVESVIKQLRGIGISPTIAQESLNDFEYDLLNSKISIRKTPTAMFMGIMRRDGVYKSAHCNKKIEGDEMQDNKNIVKNSLEQVKEYNLLNLGLKEKVRKRNEWISSLSEDDKRKFCEIAKNGDENSFLSERSLLDLYYEDYISKEK